MIFPTCDWILEDHKFSVFDSISIYYWLYFQDIQELILRHVNLKYGKYITNTVCQSAYIKLHINIYIKHKQLGGSIKWKVQQ